MASNGSNGNGVNGNDLSSLYAQEKILGPGFVNRRTKPSFIIGGRPFSRHQLINEYRIGSFRTMRILNDVCEELSLSFDELLTTPIETFAAMKGPGEETLSTLIQLKRAAHKGKVTKSLDTFMQTNVTYNTMKAKARRDEYQENLRKKKRRKAERSRPLVKEANRILHANA